jgi:hypothetical protein
MHSCSCPPPCLTEHGACSETTWPYVAEQQFVNQEPSTDAFQEGLNFLVQATQVIGKGPVEQRRALNCWLGEATRIKTMVGPC